MAEKQLRKHWPEYRKSVNALILGKRFKLDDLLRMAQEDDDFKILLKKIGLF